MSDNNPRIDINRYRKKLEALCKKWRIAELTLIGSVLTEEFHRSSDIDVLISMDQSEFDKNSKEIENDVSNIFQDNQTSLRTDVHSQGDVENDKNYIRRYMMLGYDIGATKVDGLLLDIKQLATNLTDNINELLEKTKRLGKLDRSDFVTDLLDEIEHVCVDLEDKSSLPEIYTTLENLITTRVKGRLPTEEEIHNRVSRSPNRPRAFVIYTSDVDSVECNQTSSRINEQYDTNSENTTRDLTQ